MTSEEAVQASIEALDALGVPYMLVGSFASNFYGIARSTKDADFVVELTHTSPADIGRQLGPGFILDPQMSFETITGTTRFVAAVADSPFTIEFFQLSDEPHDQERFRRRQRVTVAGRETHLPTAEDVIITKLRWSRQGSRPKDMDDAMNVIAVQGARLDWGYIDQWCDAHSTRDLLGQIRQAIPPT